MTKVNYDKRLERTLEVVNRGRVAMGMKPLKKMPKGYIGQGDSCPIQTALKVEIVDDVITLENGDNAKKLAKGLHTKVVTSNDYWENYEVAMPKTLQRFVSDFDDCKYPKLALNLDDHCNDNDDEDWEW